MFPRIHMVAGEDRPRSGYSTEPVGEGTAREETAPEFRTPEDPSRRRRTRRGRRSRQRGLERSAAADGEGRDRSPVTSQPGAPTGPRADNTSPTRASRLDLERAEAIRRLAQSLRDSPPTLRARVVRAATSLV